MQVIQLWIKVQIAKNAAQSFYKVFDMTDSPDKDNVFASPPPSDVVVKRQIFKHPIPFSMLDPDAVKIIRRLNKFGYRAYLVGGCIRDILLGIQPKDFDIATSAKPAEIKHLFRNCRLIGRRFRLAHLYFKNRKIIEVATFRRAPTAKDDLSDKHAAQNLFGGPCDDAVRRDFTINALMYDVQKQVIYDWTGGLDDIESKTIRTIGDADRRIREDPVRIIRALKFSIRLNLNIESSLYDAMKVYHHALSACAPARIIEEIFKILRSGVSAPCISMMHDIGILSTILSGLDRSLCQLKDKSALFLPLGYADKMVKDKRAVSDSVLFAALLYPHCVKIIKQKGDVSSELEKVLKPLVYPLPFTRRHMARVRQIFIAQRRIINGPKNKRAIKMLEREYAEEALDLFEMTNDQAIYGSVLARWRKLAQKRSYRSDDPHLAPVKKRRKRVVRHRRKLTDYIEGSTD
jgi:poly(A) polymerase